MKGCEEMKKLVSPVRGAARLYDIASLPLLDKNSEIRYEGSISKCGDNADWDWGLYKDSNGEWVLMEADGPGCIFNFTQHRYPTSETPEFRFYFDGSDIPQFSITPAEFGTKPPFLKPLADKFIGPDDNGRGPIWVVRSFVPMEFCSHCKVTSTVKLEGSDKALGQGGWGHMKPYTLYFSAKTDIPCTSFGAFKGDRTIANMRVITGNNCGFYMSFSEAQPQTVTIKVAVSPLSVGKAREHLLNSDHIDFQQALDQNRSVWLKYLDRIKIENMQDSRVA